MIVGTITKKFRKGLFDYYMEEGYQQFVDGLLTDSEWNAWSWHCYRFLDEVYSDEEELQEHLYV